MTHLPRRTAALILAAGFGRRFGGGKMLAEIAGRPMLQHVLDLAAAADLDPVVVVVGDDADVLDERLNWRLERRVANPDPSRGLASSLRLGLVELGESDRVIVLLGDQPYLRVEQVRSIIADRDPERPIVVPRYGEVPGNPVLLERDAFPLAAQLTGDRGMSQLFATRPQLVRYVDVPGRNPDIDSPADLKAAQASAIVASGYDELGDRFVDWSGQIDDPTRNRFVAELTGRLEPGSEILELGIGPGVNSSRTLAESFAITGVDLSRVQLDKARQAIPSGRFIQADMTEVEFAPATFDAVVALYSINHVRRDAQPELVASIHRWLRPHGLFLATFPTNGGGDWTGEWLGVEMFFSGWSAAENRQMLASAGFELLLDEIVDTDEPEGPARFQWILARPSPA